MNNNKDNYYIGINSSATGEFERPIKKTIKSKKGETVAETLFAILILALTFIALAASIMTAARVNDSVKNEDTVFKNEFAMTGETPIDPVSGTVQLTDTAGSSLGSVSVEITKFSNSYYYYTKSLTH